MAPLLPPLALRQAAHDLRAWLVDVAYPLWWRRGADLENGGYHDKLDRLTRPPALPKRARVAARQAWCFAQAPRFEWDGPWRRAMVHGLDFLHGAHRRPDGLYRASVAESSLPPANHAELYDQAFVLLALAAGEEHGEPAARQRAGALLDRLPRYAFGGFRELAGEVLLSNPNMHLFEAFMAWSAAGPGPWSELANGQARLARERLIAGKSGAIAEVFDGAWRPTPNLAEQEISPGHQFEWAWLLLRHSAMTGDAQPPDLALGLIEIAERSGVDRRRGVAINLLDGRLKPRDGTARLWPQTERIKANLRAAEITGEARYWSAAGQATESLWRYLDDSGAWRDQLDLDGGFIDEPAPASSFYHIVGAILELGRVAGGSLD